MKNGKGMASERQEIARMKPLSPMAQLFASPELYTFIVFTLGFKTRCNPSTIIKGIKETWLKLPRFSSKLVMHKKNGETVWVPVNFRVEDHVIVSNLDESNIENPDEFIEHYTSNLASTPLDMSRPLWEFHLLNIKTSNAESLAIVKIHHSIGDGMSLMSLILASSQKTSELNALPTMATTRRHVASDDKGGWWLVAAIWFIIICFLITLIETFKALLTLCFMRDSKTPLKGESGDVTRSRKVIQRVISYDDVKLVKNGVDMKVNDVLLGMTQAGLSRYLGRKYDEHKVAEKKFLKKIRLRGTVTINLRRNTKIENLASMIAKGSKCRWGNFVSLLICPLWIRCEDDPLEYVRRAKAIMDIKKISKESLVYYIFIKITMKLFGPKVAGFIFNRVGGHTTMTFSNVMGPNMEMSFFYHPMSYIAATAIGGPQALVLHYVTYVDKISINLAVDTTVIQDPHLLCDDLVESLNLMKLAILEKGARKMEV